MTSNQEVFFLYVPAPITGPRPTNLLIEKNNYVHTYSSWVIIRTNFHINYTILQDIFKEERAWMNQELRSKENIAIIIFFPNQTLMVRLLS